MTTTLSVDSVPAALLHDSYKAVTNHGASQASTREPSAFSKVSAVPFLELASSSTKQNTEAHHCGVQQTTDREFGVWRSVNKVDWTIF